MEASLAVLQTGLGRNYGRMWHLGPMLMGPPSSLMLCICWNNGSAPELTPSYTHYYLPTPCSFPLTLSGSYPVCQVIKQYCYFLISLFRKPLRILTHRKSKCVFVSNSTLLRNSTKGIYCPFCPFLGTPFNCFPQTLSGLLLLLSVILLAGQPHHMP